MKLNISDKALRITLIVLTLFMMFFGFGYVNSMVSYKYQVQDFQTAGKSPTFGLDEEQIGVLNSIAVCKWGLFVSLFFLIVMLVINERQPTFKGRVSYYTR